MHVHESETWLVSNNIQQKLYKYSRQQVADNRMLEILAEEH